MRNIFTCICLSISSLAIMATDYNDKLVVDIDGNKVEQTATISVDQQTNGKYTLSLQNFVLEAEGNQLGVGNIILNNVEGTTTDGSTLLTASQNVNITNGNLPNIPYWAGPDLGPVPVKLAARLTNGKLYSSITIYMASLSQTINVYFGKENIGYQIPNSDFELFKKEGTTDVPIAWHSFGTATGGVASMTKPSSRISTNTRTATGQCASIFSNKILIFVANGTMTTGRMNAGSTTATDPKNNAYLDMSSESKDSNNDPFYTLMNGRPDSLAVWVNFKQGTPNTSYPYATISAAITDGTYYQDPEDKPYTNVLAKAKNDTIGQTNGWKRIVIPFQYTENNITGKAILVTISTNATPGKGSGGDEILIDDIQLIYNANLSALSVNGNTVSDISSDKTSYSATIGRAVTADGIQVTPMNANSPVIKTIGEAKEGKQQVEFTIFSEDLQSSKTYQLELSIDPTGIQKIKATKNDKVGVFNINGQQVKDLQSGQVYIIKNADGTTKKFIQK